jgi:hypothetical protein
MNRNIVITCTVLALILLGGIGFGFDKLFSSEERQEGDIPVRGGAIAAVPTDAILIYDFASFDQIRDMYLAEDSQLASFVGSKSQLKEFIGICSDDFKNQGAIISVHYPAKNTIAPLLVVSIEDQNERESMKKLLSNYTSGVINKKYSGVTISKSVIPAISYTIYGSFLIVSPSHVLVESAIRHLDSGVSVNDNPLYQKGCNGVHGKSVLHVNHQNLGKFFSGAVKYEYLGLAPFFSSFASWSTFALDFADGSIDGSGFHYNVKDEANFSNIFLSQKGGTSKIFSVLPHNTEYLITIPISNFDAYLSSYKDYLEAVKKINDYVYLNAIAGKKIGESLTPEAWFKSLGVQEMAIAAVPDGKVSHKILMLRLKDPNDVKLMKGYAATLLGKFFSIPEEEGVSFVEDWAIVGERKMVEKLSEQYQNELYFSLKMYLEQTPAASICKESSAITGVVNLSKSADTLVAALKEEYGAPVVKGMDNYNFNYLTFTVGGEGDDIVPEFRWYADNLLVQPQPPVAKVETADNGAVYDETVVEVPVGPFEIKNFVNGKKNYLQQLDNKLRLLDENRRGVWTIPFDGKLCGNVAQVDHFKNNKLQMIFCSGNKLHMLDRLGRWVKPFPVTLPKSVLLGPAVYDLNSDKQYTLVVLNTDNTIGMYDMSGKAVDSWVPVPMGEKIKGLPELLEIEGVRCWVIRTGYQTLICNENGTPVADFTKKRKLSADTKIEGLSGKDVVVTTVEGKEMVLNLQTGSMKKR